MRAWLAACVVIALPAAAAALPGFGSRDAGAPFAPGAAPELLREVGIAPRLGESVPLDLVFRDENGGEVRLEELFGERPVILTLAYAGCPMLCPVTLKGLVATLRTLSLEPGRDFDILTVSIDPRETPDEARKKKNVYLNRYGRAGAAQAWRFLTGEEASVAHLARSVGFRYAYDPNRREYAHAGGIFLLTPKGRISRVLYGVEFAARDLRLGLVEASDNRIGTLADQLLLLCYHYDPETGTYGALAMRSVRVGGVLTVLALGGFLFTMFRRERQGREDR